MDNDTNGLIYTNDLNELTIQGHGKVIVKDVFTFHKDGKVIGSLDCEFDFNELNPECHTYAMRLINQMGTRLSIPGSDNPTTYTPKPKPKPKPKPIKEEKIIWWKRIFK